MHYNYSIMEPQHSGKGDSLKLMVPAGLEDFGELLAGDKLEDSNMICKNPLNGPMSNEKSGNSIHGSNQAKSFKVESIKMTRNKELVSSSGSAYDRLGRSPDIPQERHQNDYESFPFRIGNSQVENEIDDKLSVFGSNSSASKPLIHYRFDTSHLQSDLQLHPNNQATSEKQPEGSFTLDSILKYFTTKNLYFECLHYELIGYYLAFVCSLMSVYLSVSSEEKWCHAVVPFLVIDIVMLLRFGNITKKPQIAPKVVSLGLSILTYSCLIIFEFWRFASLWFITLLPFANTIYRIGWNRVQYGPKLMFPYLLIRDVQIFFCALKLVFGWPSWTGALVFAFGTAVFDICVLALFVFKITFLAINSAAKRDLKILQNNSRFG